MIEARDTVLLNGLLGAGAWAAFLYLSPPMLGLAVLALVIAYNLLLPLFARSSGHGHWFDLWWFLLPLSVCQVVPDWVLSQQLGILAFPDLGAPRIGTVPVYMAGMWVIPLFWVLLIARGSPALAGALSLLVFAAAEWAAPRFGLWQPRHVATHWGVADASTSPFQIPRFTPWAERDWHVTYQLVRNLLTEPLQVPEVAT